MKIKSLTIYGYGKWTDFEWPTISSLQVVFGPNEAGKSTLMSFIHSILFGFPTKQSNQLRYEPKFSHAYGGKLIVETQSDGEVVIERRKGKASGDVRILFEDGTIGGENHLIALLSGMNKTLYQNLFSFDLKGIQEVQKLQGEEIGRYLLAAGTVGTDHLLFVEEELKKDAEQLFKPNGRKPELNQLLQQLKEAEQELKKAKQQNSEYESIVKKREEVEEKQLTLERKLKNNKVVLQNITGLLDKWLILEEHKKVNQRLTDIGRIEFPIDGLRRYENYLDKQILIRNQLDSLHEKLERTKGLIIEAQPSVAFQQVLPRADRLIQEWTLFIQYSEDLENIKKKMEDMEERVKEIEQILNFTKENQSIDLSITVKELVRKALHDQLKIQLKVEDISKNLEITSKKLIETEEQCQKVEENLWTETEFKRLQREKEEWIEWEELLQEKKRQINDHSRHSRTILNRSNSKLGDSLLLLISLMLFVWSIFTTQWLLSIFTGAVGVYFFSKILMANRENRGLNKDLSREIQELTERLEERGKVDQPKDRYYEQLTLREEWKKLYQTLDETEQTKSSLLQQEEQITRDLENVKSHIQSYKKSLGLTSQFPDFRLEDAIDLLTEREECKIQLKKLKKNSQEKQDKQINWLQELEDVASIAECPLKDPSETVFLIKQAIKAEEEKLIKVKEWKEKKTELESEETALQREYNEYTDLLSQLLQKAATTDEESFRLKAKNYEEICQLQSRQQILQDQLNQSLHDKYKEYTSVDDVKQEHNQLLTEIKENEEILKKMNQDLATLNHEVRLLEEGGTYTERLHRFYQLRSNFQEEAMHWAKINMAISLLQKTLNNYIMDRFPKVVEKANEYFTFLTNGDYSSLFYQENNQLFVKRKDGTIMLPAELSQGTKEQLYISLRFALVFVLQNEYSFPIIIDDGFVNFDKERTKKLSELIQELSKHTQVLIFTCHDHISELFPSHCVYKLASMQEMDSESDKSHSMI